MQFSVGVKMDFCQKNYIYIFFYIKNYHEIFFEPTMVLVTFEIIIAICKWKEIFL